MLRNLGIQAVASEDGPRLDAHCALRELAPYPCWRAPAITPDVPFSVPATMAAPVVLALRSVTVRRRGTPTRVQSAASVTTYRGHLRRLGRRMFGALEGP